METSKSFCIKLFPSTYPLALSRAISTESRKGIMWVIDPIQVLLSNTTEHKNYNVGQILCINFYDGWYLHFTLEKCPGPSPLIRVKASSQVVPAKITTYIPEMFFVHDLIKWYFFPPSLALISLITHPTERPFQVYYSSQFHNSYYSSAFRPSPNLSLAQV